MSEEQTALSAWKKIIKGKPFIVVLLGALLFVIAGFTYLYAYDHGPAKENVTVDIPKKATGREIGDILAGKGVIRSSAVFKWMLFLSGKSQKLQSGHYQIRQGLTVKEAIAELQSGHGEMVCVTVPEGYTVRQTAALLEKAGISGGKDFFETATVYGPFSYMYGPETVNLRGEGFLFPDTYEIPKDYTAKQICDLMYKRTDEMISPALREKAKERNLTIYALITIASMVEREAKFKEDQGPIAAVILARLQKDMPLQIDATVQYALGENKLELTVADTRIDSPYNTYIRKGLPPGPVGSPGIEAVRAVLAAEPGEYLYYVAQPDGHHIFTKTYEEHRAEVEKIYGESS